MLYNVPETFNKPDLLFHKFQTMAEQNALNQARRSRVFPIARLVNQSIRLKDGRILGKKGLSGSPSGRMSPSGQVSPRINYNSKSAPYLSRRTAGKQGLSGITDFFTGIKNTITGTVGAVTGTVTGVANAAQPLEKLLQENPSLINLVKTYLPGPSTLSQPTIVAVQNPSATSGATLGVSNKVWMIGAAGAGALALVKILNRR